VVVQDVETVDVVGLWEAQLDAPPVRRRPGGEVLGPRGWTVAVAGLGADAAARLLDVLDGPQLDVRQGDGPTLGALLRAAVAHPGVVEVHGHAVGPRGADERLVAEGAFLYALPDLQVPEWPHDGPCECTRLWATARDGYGLGDARGMPQELQRRANAWRPRELCWRLGWE
jgi:hypothetical protein